MSLQIRPVEPGDLPKMLAMMCEHALFERADPPRANLAHLADALFGVPRCLHAWIALVDGQYVGYMTATRDYSTWQAAPFVHMDCLYVRAGHRDAGVGARLMTALREFCVKEGIDQIQWQTPDWNSGAARFYQRLGARQWMKRRFIWSLLPE